MPDCLETIELAPQAAGTEPSALRDLEIHLLLEGVFRHYGYDFREYSFNSLRRRVLQFRADERVPTVSALQERVLHDAGALERLVVALSVPVTSFFRQPGLFRAFREKVVPVLRTYPALRLWHAGCASGEEVYSMAVLLEEEGLLSRAQLYATDMNGVALQQATGGTYDVSAVEKGEADYRAGGGRGRLIDYCDVRAGRAAFHAALRRHAVFAEHNLVTDGSFNEFNVILCRNVLIYFNRVLQNRVHELLHASLARLGFLGLGDRETIRFTAVEDRYQEVDVEAHLYRKVA
jgi:chemotaxis protein methyltransferase CheR